MIAQVLNHLVHQLKFEAETFHFPPLLQGRKEGLENDLETLPYDRAWRASSLQNAMRLLRSVFPREDMVSTQLFKWLFS